MIQKLESRINQTQSLLCVGLDFDCADSFKVCKSLIEQTHLYTATYKINSAFYEAHGMVGIKNLEKIIAYLQKYFANIPIILDNKRGDVDHTNDAYYRASFEHLKVDAITLHPYLGLDALSSFFKSPHHFAFILCRTSNKASTEFQNLKIIYKKDTMHLWQIIANKIIAHRHALQMGVVMSAHAISEIKWLRTQSQNLWFLVPGIGVQGGKLNAVLKNGLNKKKQGLLINVSRSIMRNPSLAKEYYLAINKFLS